ncbi:GNAT family N-acetyltransferase [Hymenobacter chitinivorans]|uniref:Putative GNAT family N-acyltransferase n=1 Tax=Hymenobacter chitinivorans DSM 11115 TaxID=1121954 RepID=A0A2M9BA20_9BACT|nr:GNAT family N-acetyltransferase [Hymenobacter chitinivorans]PJJ54789.1 putative GNAT family N-acyltransferase [Hymenobacter chitinivorans DSM 11115]
MTTPSVAIRPITPEQTYPLRHAVLWPDKPREYVQVENDGAGYHFGAFLGEELVAVISLFVDAGQARFRKFATAPEWQKQGIGSRLLERVMQEARQLGAGQLWCDARQDAAAFYQRFGMVGEGPVFYKGDIPYQRMRVGL